MWPLTQIKEAAIDKLSQLANQDVREELVSLRDENWLLQENYGRLELEIENEGYTRLSNLYRYDFNKHKLDEIISNIVQMAIKNPITNRTINVQADYVFGRGVRFVAANEEVQGWVDEFCAQRENAKTLMSSSAMRHQERSLQIQGNRFFVLFSAMRRTGRVLIRSLETHEVDDIVRDPDDYQLELFIRRCYYVDGVQIVNYHPMLGITKRSGVKKPWQIGQDNPRTGEIIWNAPVVHVRFNVFGKEKFAVPELWPSIDWATSYKKFLQDWSSIIGSFARMALKITGIKGSKQMAATKNKFGTTVKPGAPFEKNPSQTPGGMSLVGRDLDIEAVKTAGATTPAKEGAPLLNMAAAGAGLPNHFYGDSSQGNYSTAKTLDRPTELKMLGRQKLWDETFTTFLNHVTDQRGMVEYGAIEIRDPFTGEVQLVPNWPKDYDHSVKVVFPDILERNVTDRVRALVNAVTMFGKPLTDIIPDKSLVARLLMEALGMDDIDKHLKAFLLLWEKNIGAEPGVSKEANLIPPAAIAGGGGAEDPSQGGDVGSGPN